MQNVKEKQNETEQNHRKTDCEIIS